MEKIEQSEKNQRRKIAKERKNAKAKERNRKERKKSKFLELARSKAFIFEQYHQASTSLNLFLPTKNHRSLLLQLNTQVTNLMTSSSTLLSIADHMQSRIQQVLVPVSPSWLDYKFCARYWSIQPRYFDISYRRIPRRWMFWSGWELMGTKKI